MCIVTYKGCFQALLEVFAIVSNVEIKYVHWFITTFQAVQLVWKLEHGYSFVTVELIYFSTILQTLTDLRTADSCS